ncbi:MAG: response regulator [Fluviicoccus sp.]|uniref:response regulator n=1 Tax=Fluviicoccus sp. TaxID=2003552 RepID=UPI0027185A29|nr:response regulator [Fluviicoccus sp.]MDO8329190.1 response regulator [Fluviicoccus sp.]
MIKVLVVDDHDLVRMGISRMLADVRDISVVGEACSGEDALRMVRELKPHVVLMDIQMPGIGGLEATRKLLQAHPDVHILAVTACNEEPLPSMLMKAGASGYVTKGTPLPDMLAAIRSVSVGQPYLSSDVAQEIAINSLQKTETPFDVLSEREAQVALMIVNCQNNQEIADRLNVSPKTISTYRARIYEKLRIDSDVKLTLMALRHGLLQNDK